MKYKELELGKIYIPTNPSLSVGEKSEKLVIYDSGYKLLNLNSATVLRFGSHRSLESLSRSVAGLWLEETALHLQEKDFQPLPLSVKKLRREGWKVRVLHCRLYNVVNGEFFPTAKGGNTRIELTTPSGEDFYGDAVCHPLENYNKKEGVRIALERAYELAKNNALYFTK
jgi:hypothetical protein